MSVRIVDHSEEFTADLIAAVEKGLGSASLVGAESAKASMPGAGAVATGKGRGRNKYRASNPGEPPGVRTSRLKNSVANQRIWTMVWGFGTNVRYGRWNELGTRMMAPRPWLRPVLIRDRMSIERAFVQASSLEMSRRAVRRAA